MTVLSSRPPPGPQELRKHGVTLHMLLETERQAIPDVPAVYYVQPSEAGIARIVQDVQRGLYDSYHINFATHVPRPLLERLAAGGSLPFPSPAPCWLAVGGMGMGSCHYWRRLGGNGRGGK